MGLLLVWGNWLALTESN